MATTELYDCPDCGAGGITHDEDGKCTRCGYTLVDKQTLEKKQTEVDTPCQTNSEKQAVSIKVVAIVYFGGLLLAMLITWTLNGFPPYWYQYAILFPEGLVNFFFTNKKFPFGYGHVIYMVMFICAFVFRRKSFFITLLVVYIIILCLNISGCLMPVYVHFH